MRRSRLLASLFVIGIVLTAFVPMRIALAAGTSTRSLPSLTNSDDQRGLNIFLSNFSESGVCEGLYTNEFVSVGAKTEELVSFAFTNYAQNGGKVEQVTRGKWNVRVDASSLDTLLGRLCGVTIKDWQDLNRHSQWYQYYDGYVYTQITNGFPLYGPAVATSIEEYRKGTLKVNFDAYYYPAGQTRYTIGDKSQYSMREYELNKLLGVDGPNRRGYAIVWATQTQSGWQYQLVSYKLTDTIRS